MLLSLSGNDALLLENPVERRTPSSSEGVRFTSFYVASPVCSPSRAALLTGSYPHRVSIPRVLFPQFDVGLHPDEVTIAELLKPLGYATAIFGKWHLGHHPEHLPAAQGFDEYFGLPSTLWPSTAFRV